MKPKWNASEKFIDLSKNRFQVRTYIYACVCVWERKRARVASVYMKKKDKEWVRVEERRAKFNGERYLLHATGIPHVKVCMKRSK